MEVDVEGYACAALIVGATLLEDQPNNRPGRVWAEEWLLKRKTYGSFYTLNKEFRLQEKLFHKYIRMPLFLE